MQVNPEDGPPEIYVTWSDPRMTDFENRDIPIKREKLDLYCMSLETHMFFVWP